MSRLGKKPITVPKDVKIEIKENRIFVEGPKGKLQFGLSGRINIEVKDGQLFVKSVSNTKLDKSLHGLHRSLIANMVKGVTEGYLKEMEIVGVGYKAQIDGNNLVMQLRFTHPVNVSIPEGIKIETPKPTHIVVKGIDKALVGKIASEIRAIYPPEPYKGTGIRYLGEQVKKKVGKSAATGGGK